MKRLLKLLVAGGFALLVVSMSSVQLLAQSGSQLAPGAPGWCVYCTPPGVVPPVDPPPGPDDPNPEEPPPTSPPSGSRGWGALGAAGLALAAGIPLGSALQPTLPFRPVIAEGPGAVPEEVAADPGPIAVQAAPGVLVPEEVDPVAMDPAVQQEAAGVLAPATASHLPLLLAIGIASIAGGVALLRDQQRRRRRRARIRI